MINQHYLTRYEKFIATIASKGLRKLEYDEVHHIQPRCLGGSDLPENKIALTLREHFLAHWMLFNAHYGTFNIMSAFYQMCNKNPKLEFKRKQMKFAHGVISRVYEKKKKQMYQLISEMNTGKVYVTEIETGKKVRINTKDFDRQQYQHSNLGKLSVTELASGKKISITPGQYDTALHSFHTTGRLVCLDTIENKMVSIPTAMYYGNKTRYTKPEGTFHFIDSKTKNVIHMMKSVANELNRQLGYKRYTQQVNSIIGCVDANGNSLKIHLAEYNPAVHQHFNKDSVVVFDTTVGRHVSISADRYNPSIHITNSTNMVVSRDSSGNSCLVSKEEFAAGNYTGVTKGMTTVKNADTGKYEQITLAEFELNRKKFKGPCYQKTNVIDIRTGIRSQIPKLEFNPEIHVNLGKNNQYFLVRNKLTSKTKNVSIYEWNKTIMPIEWDVIDNELFEKRKKLL